LQPQLSQEILGDIDTSNIILGGRSSRSRKPRDDRDYVAYMAMHIEELSSFLAAFAYGLYAEKPEKRRHRDDLPPLPKHWKDVQNHPF
jgi:hypothetical protein